MSIRQILMEINEINIMKALNNIMSSMYKIAVTY